jgi:hypothetical protein
LSLFFFVFVLAVFREIPIGVLNVLIYCSVKVLEIPLCSLRFWFVRASMRALLGLWVFLGGFRVWELRLSRADRCSGLLGFGV